MGQNHSSSARRRNRRTSAISIPPATTTSPNISPSIFPSISQQREQEMSTFGTSIPGVPFHSAVESSSNQVEESTTETTSSDLPQLIEESDPEEQSLLLQLDDEQVEVEPEMQTDPEEIDEYLPPLQSNSDDEEEEESMLSSLFDSPSSQDEITQTENDSTSSPSPSSNSSSSFRLNIIYYVPNRRNRNNESGTTETNSQELEAPTSIESLLSNGNFRILFALTIPMATGMGLGGNLSSMEGNSFGNPFGNPFGEGSSFEDLLDHLMRQHQPQGPPPTSKSVLNRLKSIQVDEEMTEETCLVCQENFIVEETALKLPCKHLFHKGCVTTWLEKHCTCPTCRYELPVDDKDYETERKKRMAGRNIDENNYEEEEMETDPNEIREESDNFLVEKCSSPTPQEHKETLPLSSQ